MKLQHSLPVGRRKHKAFENTVTEKFVWRNKEDEQRSILKLTSSGTLHDDIAIQMSSLVLSFHIKF